MTTLSTYRRPLPDVARIEQALNHHPAVKSIRATAIGDGASIDIVPDLRCAEIEHAQLARWREVYEESFASGDIGDMLHGWTSSYTGQPLPRAEMEEWVALTVERIRSLEPRHVVEIGSGTGLLVDRIAPRTGSYLAIDSAEACQTRLSALIARRPDLAHVRQRVADAADLPTKFGPGVQVDTVILNSIVQYFPNAAYLGRVIGRALDWIEEGALFIGDVRDLRLLPDFYESLARARGLADPDAVSHFVADKFDSEEELAIDPAFFHRLRDTCPRIREIRTLPKHGHYRNELNDYRYDVLMSVGQANSGEHGIPDIKKIADGPLTNEPAMPLARSFLPALLRKYLEDRSLIEGATVDIRIVGVDEKPARSEEARPDDGTIEARLTALWRECLGKPHLKPDADFFASGGSSLLLMQLRRRIADGFGVSVPLSVFATAPTPRAIGAYVRDSMPKSGT